MPEFYKNTEGGELLAVRYDELVPRFYKTENYLRRKVSGDMKRGFGLRRIARGHNSGMALIEFDSLPLEVQDQLDDPRRSVQAVEKYYTHNAAAERYYAAYRLPDGRTLAPEIRQRYTANASTMEAVLALKADREMYFARCGKKPPMLWQNLCKDAVDFKTIQLKKFNYEHNLPENYRRFQEAVQNYANAATKQEAWAGLVSGKHISSSVGGARKVNEQMRNLFESLFTGLGYKPNYTDVYNVYADFLAGRKEIVSHATGEVLQPADFQPVSEGTIRAYLSGWESQAATLRLRTGDRQKLMGETKPYHSMEVPEWAGSLLSIDDRQPPFEYAKGERVWFYLGYDLGADCYTTLVWGKDKQGIILDFYRQMVRNYAEWGLSLPAELECESNLNASFKDTFLREGSMFQYVRIEANNARGKKIENRNRAMRYGDERRSEGWIARPFAGSEANRAGTDKVPMLPFDTIVEQTLQRYEKWNNEPHPRHPEMSRWEFFMTRQNPKLQPINWLAIVPSLGYTAKSSCHTGIVRLNHGECLLGLDGKIATGDTLIDLMKQAEGETLDIKWIDGNDGRVLKAFAYIGGRLICELLPKPTYHRARIEQTDADTAARELMSKYVATVEGYGNRRKKNIEKITILEAPEPEIIAETAYTFVVPQRRQAPKATLQKAQEVQQVIDTDDENDLNPYLTNIERSFKRKLADTF